MNILPVIFGKLNNNQNIQIKQYADSRVMMPKYRNQLDQDTVTFGSTMTDTVWHKFVKELPRLMRIGTTYLDATEAIAAKLKDDGVTFVREMFEATVVKEPDSKLSKVNRSKTFDVRDAIRTTLFSKNPYDVSILFDKLIPEYGKRGYHIANIPMYLSELMERGYVPFEEEKYIKMFFTIPHTKESHNLYFRELKKLGYDYDDTKKLLAIYLKEDKIPNRDEMLEIIGTLKKEVPDIDIRLKKKKIDIDAIPEEYKYALGKPQKSGYEDIQIRFIRDVDKDVNKKKKKEPVYHELLIQFGPTYNRNAYKEHKLVYEPLRLFKELQIPLENPIKGVITFKDNPEKGVEKFISDIQKMFREGVSNKLIQNGKNEDFFGNIEDNEDIFFANGDIEKFERRFKNIKGFMAEYYNQAKAGALASDLSTEQITNDFKSDMKLINQIHKKLRETIDTLNYEYDLKCTNQN